MILACLILAAAACPASAPFLFLVIRILALLDPKEQECARICVE